MRVKTGAPRARNVPKCPPGESVSRAREDLAKLQVRTCQNLSSSQQGEPGLISKP